MENKIIVVINGTEESYDFDAFGLNFDSSDSEIKSAIAGAVQEKFAVDISEYYKVQKVLDKRNVYIFPNSTAGV